MHPMVKKRSSANDAVSTDKTSVILGEYIEYLQKYPDNFLLLSPGDVIIRTTDPSTGKKEIVRVPRPTYSYLVDDLHIAKTELREAMKEASVREYISSVTKDTSLFLSSLDILDKKISRVWDLETYSVDIKRIRTDKAREEVEHILQDLTLRFTDDPSNTDVMRTSVYERMSVASAAIDTTSPLTDRAIVKELTEFGSA